MHVALPIQPVQGKRTPRAVLTGMCYSVGCMMRQGSSSLTRLTGQLSTTGKKWVFRDLGGRKSMKLFS
ncbi:hypothetical protein FNH59_23845 [Salmonella enterica subsp. enterica]|nr:hypothetical protein [Salmonella enterica subsp. enterica serovar Infantis]ECC1244692.1 hypothetical protein [Salmonella enterica subsp. enterica serovar Poona]ECF3858867.1 hypothetical protein [Salmonella enterica subsp. enterica serovar Poona]ECH8971253.1 hypothetical protein [Salmonella enterica subsp. enterica]EDY4584245.1 hypothetical protein [Salmonella enterica]